MLFKDAFKPRVYQQVYAVGYYTAQGDSTTIITRVGKQTSQSCLKIPTVLFDTLKVDDTTKAITNLPPCLVVRKDSETGFRKLEYVDPNKVETDDSED